MFRKILCAAIGGFMLAGVAHAAWPTNPVTIVVPFAAGQTGDIIARLMGKELAATLGQPFVVDNRPGNGGQIGTAYAAKAKPDGYTLLLTSSGPFAIAPALYPKTTQYNAVKDFVGIAEAASTPQVIAVSNKSGIASFAELVKEAKTKDLSYGSAGNGSTQHLTMEMLKKELGFPLVHVPFKGSAESKIQVISGLIEVTSDSLPAIYANIKSKQMKPLVVVDTKRSAYLPDIPTIAEAGFSELSTLAFFGLVAPKDTPKEVIDLLNKQITQLFRTSAFQEKMKVQALTLPVERTPEQFTAYLSSEVARWKQIVDKANVEIEKY